MTASLYWLPALAAVAPASVTAAPCVATDEALMLRFRDGDEESFRLLYQRIPRNRCNGSSGPEMGSDPIC